LTSGAIFHIQSQPERQVSNHFNRGAFKMDEKQMIAKARVYLTTVRIP
jgi:hypothetical protein